ncbi:MAG: hypothetical protein R6U86_05160 [Bacteroidales bacterium]
MSHSPHKQKHSRRSAKWILVAFVLLLLGSGRASAQFMQLQLIINNEVAIHDARNLQLGEIPLQFGWVQVEPGDEFSGRFSIVASENVNVIVSIQSPEELIKDATNRLPFQVKAGYLNNGTRLARQATPFNSSQARFALSGKGQLAEQLRPADGKIEATVYLFGAAYAGEVSPGLYKGTITITTEYE